jgi:hypothetical protein
VTRLVLIEAAPDTFRAEPDDLVVALTPEACYELDRREVPYKLTTDFGIDGQLAELEPMHWQEQLGWFDALDELIAEHVPETKLWRFGAATLYAFNLKAFIDPVRVRALELSPLLDSCDRVILHRRASVEPPITFLRVIEGRSVTSRVLPLLAHARGLELEERIANVDTAPPEPVPAVAGSAPEPGRLEQVEARLRRAYRRLLRGQRLQRATSDRPLTLLFADFGYDLTYLLTRAREWRHRCLRVVGDAVLEDGAEVREVARLPTEGADAGWASVAEAVTSADHDLWVWPNSWVPGVPLAEVIRPRVVYWLERVMPLIAARTRAFDALRERENVDFVLGANVALPDVVAAAAVSADPTQSVLVDHGHSAYASELFDLILLRHVHHNFCATSEFARYMESRRALYDKPTAELHVGSYQWRANAALSRSGEPPEPVPDAKQVVVYALTATAGNGHYLNSAWYVDGWYYRLCREIVDALARHPEVHSVVKLFPGDGIIRNPIDLYVRDLGLDHVVASRAPLRSWIPRADRIVFDLPSTGLYETAAAGIPYLALLYTHHRHRQGAVESLGPAAVPFTEPAEAARAVEAFVTSPTVTAPRLLPEGDEILTTLERLAKR